MSDEDRKAADNAAEAYSSLPHKPCSCYDDFFTGYLAGLAASRIEFCEVIANGCEKAKAGKSLAVVAFLDAIRDEMVGALSPKGGE